MKKRVFAGIRATGRLHLGNYLGAVKGMIRLQEKYNCIFAVVDLHTITVPYDPKKLQEAVFNVVVDYLAAGLDPGKCHLIIQSQVPEHVELAYLLGTIYPVSRVEQLPTYKDKKEQYPKYINVGLFYYPILMAADILVYKAELVPAGSDQEPHIEVAREIARKFNRMFGKTFPSPLRFSTPGDYVPSLAGEGKMSKSVEGSYINLTDDLNTIKAKLAKTPTDLGRGIKVPQSGGVFSLLTLVRLLEGKEKSKFYEKKYKSEGIKYSALKNDLAKAIYSVLEPIQERRRKIAKDKDYISQVLTRGKKNCSIIAQKTVTEVKEKMGLS